MKTVLVCIAKDEDPYIDEWIKYHTKLGFDYVYVYQNNWRYKGDKSQYNNVHWIEFDGNVKQLESYQNFIKYHNEEYDWAAFFDVDEYLTLCYQKNLSDWLINFNDYFAVGVNWRMFGDNGLNEIISYSLVNRFTKASKDLNQHIKTILNFKKCRDTGIIDQLKFGDPHSFVQSHNDDFTIATDKYTFIHGPYNQNPKNYTAQLNHYYCKTYSEFINIKVKRGFADTENQYRLESFAASNCNDINDFKAKDFYNS